jgi:hypothetical protein
MNSSPGTRTEDAGSLKEVRANASRERMVAMNARMPAALENSGSVITALLVGPFDGDHAFLSKIFLERNWILYHASNCTEALTLIRETVIPVVICERNLRDGNWRILLAAISTMPQSPRLLVSASSVDVELLNQVRRIGGYSVLASPFDASEIDVQVQLAWHSWHRQWRNAISTRDLAPDENYGAAGDYHPTLRKPNGIESPRSPIDIRSLAARKASSAAGV